MCICSFTELKIYKFKSINSFLGFFGSLSSWSILFSVWKMDLEHWNVSLIFVWTLITLLFISKYNPGILRILKTFDSWIIEKKSIGDLKDIYFICKNKTSVFHYYLELRGDALLCPAPSVTNNTREETKTEAEMLAVMSICCICVCLMFGIFCGSSVIRPT